MRKSYKGLDAIFNGGPARIARKRIFEKACGSNNCCPYPLVVVVALSAKVPLALPAAV